MLQPPYVQPPHRPPLRRLPAPWAHHAYQRHHCSTSTRRSTGQRHWDQCTAPSLLHFTCLPPLWPLCPLTLPVAHCVLRRFACHHTPAQAPVIAASPVMGFRHSSRNRAAGHSQYIYVLSRAVAVSACCGLRDLAAKSSSNQAHSEIKSNQVKSSRFFLLDLAFPYFTALDFVHRVPLLGANNDRHIRHIATEVN